MDDAARWATQATRPGHAQPGAARSGTRQAASGWLVRTGLRALVGAHLLAIRAGARFGPRTRSVAEGQRHDVLLTLTSHAEAWAAAHLRPLAMSSRVAGVTVVTSSTLPRIDGVRTIRPWRWLARTIGEVPARLLTFSWVSLRRRPDLIGGFHLQMNGLAAAMLARLSGARSIYLSVGGPREIVGGGVRSENRIFARLHEPDAALEAQLIDVIRSFDLVVTMGTRAAGYLREHGVTTACRVIPGGIDHRAFAPGRNEPDIDVVFVGRLVPIKRVDLLLEAVRHAANTIPGLRAAIVGDGPLRLELEELARRLRLERQVTFAGHQRDVAPWLRRSRIFMLTSESEGLSLSLMEALAGGVVPVVADVGDIADLVQHGVNGYLVSERSPEAFAAPLVRLLREPAVFERLRAAAALSGRRLSVEAAVAQWNSALAEWDARSS